LESLWNQFKFAGGTLLEEMSETGYFDREHIHPTAASLNFVTNMVGCLNVAEALKLLTGGGKVIE
jgi:hypothetical protein